MNRQHQMSHLFLYRYVGQSSDPCFWLRILDPDPAIFIIDLQHAGKKLIFSAYYFLKVHLHHFSKIKSQKESQNISNQGFSYYFCMMIEGSGSGSIPLTSGSGSGSGSWRPKNMWIRWNRIRIRNTENKTSRILYLDFFSSSDPESHLRPYCSS